MGALIYLVYCILSLNRLLLGDLDLAREQMLLAEKYRSMVAGSLYKEELTIFSPDYLPRIEDGTILKGQKICIMVEDNGPGIPAANLEKIFQTFFTTKPPGEGTGLGLSISFEIIRDGVETLGCNPGHRSNQGLRITAR